MPLTVSPDDLVIISLLSINSVVVELVKSPSWMEVPLNVRIDEQFVTRGIWRSSFAFLSPFNSRRHPKTTLMSFIVKEWHLIIKSVLG